MYNSILKLTRTKYVKISSIYHHTPPLYLNIIKITTSISFYGADGTPSASAKGAAATPDLVTPGKAGGGLGTATGGGVATATKSTAKAPSTAAAATTPTAAATTTPTAAAATTPTAAAVV